MRLAFYRKLVTFRDMSNVAEALDDFDKAAEVRLMRAMKDGMAQRGEEATFQRLKSGFSVSMPSKLFELLFSDLQ
jgi:hypothetical protein